jgi:hypothetical protein
MADGQKRHAGAVRIVGEFKSRPFAQWLGQIQIRTESQTQRACKRVFRCLCQYAIGHGAAGRNADQYGRKIGGVVKVSLNVVAQVFEIAVGEYALAAIGPERDFEFRQVDADHHRPLLHELLRQGVRAAVPALIAGQEKHEAGRFAGGRIDREIVESAVAQRRRRGPDGSAQEHQRGEGQADTQEADTQESDIQESDIQESDIQESDIQESDIQERVNIHGLVTLQTQNVHG